MRLANPTEAREAASIIKDLPGVVEEPQVPLEEIQVQVRFLLSMGEVIVQLFVFSVRAFLAGLVIAILFSGVVGRLIGIGFVFLYLGLILWALLATRRRKVRGWVRFEAKSLVVRTVTRSRSTTPKVLEWKSVESFVLKGPGSKLEFTFYSGREATNAVVRIKLAFPDIREIQVC